MGRPKKPDEQRTVPVSMRLVHTGVARIDTLAETRGTDRSEVIKMLLRLGLKAWDRGDHPPVPAKETP
jgi:hypothetical protein